MKKKLKHSLEQLRRELASGGIEDPQVRALLEQHVVDIEQQIENPEDAADPDDLASQLKESVMRFEVEHPKLAAVVNEIMQTLSNIGI